jgi:hypothetical protein
VSQKVLLITPPFTQLNTPYPATVYIKGFLNTLQVPAFQADLGIEVMLDVFNAKRIRAIFDYLENTDDEIELSENAYRVYQLKDEYIATIDPVIRFLQHKNPTLALSICDRTYLPEGHHFRDTDDLEWAFGSMGTHDKARHLATLYLEDLGDFIAETLDPHFGFNRYAERLGRTTTHFAPLQEALALPNTLISEILVTLLEQKIQAIEPTVVCLTVPFPGNLFGALKCGQYIKQHHPAIKVVMGGGYCNTELRSLSDPNVFDFVDFICLDDGEAPLQILLEYLAGSRPIEQLKRTYSRHNGEVVYWNRAVEKDISQRATGTPDYGDLPLNDYLSIIEIINPMHRLWSDGRWNKLTLAHGCYWGKCSFCDISLDYIKNYEPITAALLCDRMEEIMAQTQQNGFHFVDEAAPPALLRELSLEIIRRKMTVTWWTNIRFEKNFTADLARLMKAAGCIALSGGLEVASDRLLALMKKGVTVAQVAMVADHFTQAGIMVHAYLMYGFPTQTTQETIDSLEMVRQLFMNGVIQSGFWHQFAMTSHSPVGLAPETFGVKRIGPTLGGFADNDLYHDDPKGAKHELFSEGLKISLFNYMQGMGFDLPLQKWFNFKVPHTSIPPRYIEKCLSQLPETTPRKNAQIVWLGANPSVEIVGDSPKKQWAVLTFYQKKETLVIETPVQLGQWIAEWIPQINIMAAQIHLYSHIKENFEKTNLGNFERFLQSSIGQQLKDNGLLVL